MLKALKDASVQPKSPVFLVCIEQELESWLLADEIKISNFLSTDAHSYVAKKVSKPDSVQNPKSVMMNHFKQARGLRYDDKVHALRVIALEEPHWKRLRRSNSFFRFESKILGN